MREEDSTKPSDKLQGLFTNLTCGVLGEADNNALNIFCSHLYQCGITQGNLDTYNCFSEFLKAKKPVEFLFIVEGNNFSLPQLKQVKANFPATPLILVSKRFELKNVTDYIEEGIDDYLDLNNLTPSLLGKSIFYILKKPIIHSYVKPEENVAEIPGKYRSLFENSLAAVLFSKPDGQILDCNKATENLCGYTKQELLAHGRRLFIDHTDPKLHGYLAERKNKQNSKGELTIRTKNGEEKVCLFSSTIFVGINNEEFTSTILIDITDRKKANLAIKRSEEKFKSLIQNGSGMIAILDKDGRYVYVSPSTTPLINIAPEDILGKIAFDFIHPEDVEKVLANFKDLDHQKQIKFPPFRFRDGNHSWQWIDTIATNLINEPNIQGIVINSRVVSEQVELEQQLSLALGKMQNIMDSSLDIICSMDAKGRFVSVNKASDAILGYSPEELEGKKVIDFIFPEDIPKTISTAKTIISGKNLTNFENRYIRKDGRLVHLFWSGHWNDEQQLMFTVARDATERMKADAQIREINEELRQSNEKFQYSLKATNETIWAYDIAKDELVWSEGIERHFGHSLENNKESIQDWANKIHEEDRKRVSKSFAQAIKGDENFWFEKYQFVKQDGEISQVLDRGYIVRDNSGKAKKVVGAVLDITENYKKSLEIEEKNKKLMEITWMQSHLVRAPLARIMGLASIIEEAPEGEKKTEAIKYLKISAQELDNITREIVKKSEQVNRNEL